jgi:hypothetical protein
MLAHTFRGTTWRSALGLEDAREVFRRYRVIRTRERDYLDWPDPLPALSALETPPAGGMIDIPWPTSRMTPAHVDGGASSISG